MFSVHTPNSSDRSLHASVFLRSNPTSFIETGPYCIHCLHAGSGNPLIMIHGGGMWLYSFRHNTGPLSRTLSVYAPDLPGHGFSSSSREDPMDHRTMVRAIGSFMDALGISRASLAGHSWGGGWVLDFAETCPDRVDRIVLIDSGGLDVPEVFEWELLKLPVIGSFLFRTMTRERVRKSLLKSFYRTSLVDDDMVREVYLNIRRKENREAQARQARTLSWKKTEEGLHTLTHPVLLIWGQEDRYLPVKLTKRFQSHIRNIRTEIIPHCGHSPHEECPDTVNRLIAEFLSG